MRAERQIFFAAKKELMRGREEKLTASYLAKMSVESFSPLCLLVFHERNEQHGFFFSRRGQQLQVKERGCEGGKEGEKTRI